MVLPGAGSSADFVRRAFLLPLRAAGYALVAPQPVPGADLVPAAFRSLDAAAAEHGPRLRLVGGISLGAHTAARWTAACRADVDGVLLVLPAWTGAPGGVAAATAESAGLVERLGTAGALAAAWPAYGDGLAPSLRAAAAAPGPTPAELSALGVPAGLVAFPDDPLHPAAVAHEWAAAIPRAAVRELPLAAPAADRSILGTTALAALTAARLT